MAIDFLPAGLSDYAAKTGTDALTKAADKTSEEILAELGIPVKQPGDDFGLNFEDYLTLMVEQLKNQTMDSAMDSSEMLNQLIQMSTVQMMSSLQTSMQTIADGVAMNYAASLVGKTVTVGKPDNDGNLQEIVGTVTGTGTYQGDMVIFVDGDMYTLNSIMAVGTLPKTEGTNPPAEGETSGQNGDSAEDNVEVAPEEPAAAD